VLFHPPRRARAWALGIGLCGLLAWAGARPAAAESALRFPEPGHFGDVPAITYDPTGHRIGPAQQRVTELAGRHVLIESTGGTEGGASMTVMAELAPAPDGHGLQLLWEKSHSYDQQGRSLGIMWIDHQKGEVLCTHPDEPDGTLRLPDPDRVANIPLNLLFLPLVHGQEEEVDFEFVVCHGPRVVKAHATVARHIPEGAAGRSLVEVRYSLDFGPLLSVLARPFIPRFAFWFDPSRRDPWIAHRIPLFSGGPEVLVVRAGVTPASLGLKH
jgi:hypothetical protein